jgi:hypothetical protein
MNQTQYTKYCKRGDFEWYPIDCDYRRVFEEECTYKGKGCSAVIRSCPDGYEIEVDNLVHDPSYIYAERKSRNSARELVERIIRNDRDGNWDKNLKYA